MTAPPAIPEKFRMPHKVAQGILYFADTRKSVNAFALRFKRLPRSIKEEMKLYYELPDDEKLFSTIADIHGLYIPTVGQGPA